jgi:hypothetical protein
LSFSASRAATVLLPVPIGPIRMSVDLMAPRWDVGLTRGEHQGRLKDGGIRPLHALVIDIMLGPTSVLEVVLAGIVDIVLGR